ncbi:MAG TPA: hypothetical protein VHP56_02300 [Solirubrobacterales bacterium]|jgi:hypothetical protein|nr:hypothetical protein [Solirubrobacterales bacterium]
MAALAAMGLIGLVAGTASATTVEINGVAQTGAVAIEASIESGKSMIFKDTAGFSQNTCTTSVAKGTTETKTGTAVTGKLSLLTFSNCTRTLTVHKPGALEYVWNSGTTNATVYSEEAQITSGSPIGTLNCTTGATTHIGTLTGVTAADIGAGHLHGTLHFNALINCGIISSAKWEASYTITTPEKIGFIN